MKKFGKQADDTLNSFLKDLKLLTEKHKNRFKDAAVEDARIKRIVQPIGV